MSLVAFILIIFWLTHTLNAKPKPKHKTMIQAVKAIKYEHSPTYKLQGIIGTPSHLSVVSPQNSTVLKIMVKNYILFIIGAMNLKLI